MYHILKKVYILIYGQGRNTGFKDCLIFSELLQQHGKDLHRAASQYAEETCKDTHVMAM